MQHSPERLDPMQTPDKHSQQKELAVKRLSAVLLRKGKMASSWKQGPCDAQDAGFCWSRKLRIVLPANLETWLGVEHTFNYSISVLEKCLCSVIGRTFFEVSLMIPKRFATQSPAAAQHQLCSKCQSRSWRYLASLGRGSRALE